MSERKNRSIAGLFVAAACVATLATMGRATIFLVVAMVVCYVLAMFLAIGGGILNGLGHLALSGREGGYFPGAYTGVLALLVGSLLTYRMMLGPARVRR